MPADHFEHFDRQFDEAQRRARRAQWIVSAFVLIVWVALMAAVIASAVMLIQLGPAGIGAALGHAVAAFDQARAAS